MSGRALCFLLLAFLCALQGNDGKTASSRSVHGTREAGDEDWGYVEVRPGAHMFYWLYYSTAAADPLTRPLVIWLEGGPGGSSTGFANFEMFGPLDINLQSRNNSWVEHCNLLFIDNPVGSGYSYVEDLSLLTTNNADIASDLLTFIKHFLTDIPEFSNVPIYIITQSYGGKMTVEFAVELDKAAKAGDIVADLRAVALGDPYISPVDNIVTMAEYMLHTGLVDTRGYESVNKLAQDFKDATESGRWEETFYLWLIVYQDVLEQSHGVDFYNILTRKIASQQKNIYDKMFGLMVNPHLILDDLMNGPIREKLQQRTPQLAVWAAQSVDVYNALTVDMFRPTTLKVEELLNNTEVRVLVYSGQLDLLVDTPGTLAWVERLTWTGSSEWLAAPRDPLVVDSYIEGYVKEYGQLSFWWIDRAGHLVIYDNPMAGMKLLLDVIGAQ